MTSRYHAAVASRFRVLKDTWITGIELIGESISVLLSCSLVVHGAA
jgi:hypothetical protein